MSVNLQIYQLVINKLMSLLILLYEEVTMQFSRFWLEIIPAVF